MFLVSPLAVRYWPPDILQFHTCVDGTVLPVPHVALTVFGGYLLYLTKEPIHKPYAGSDVWLTVQRNSVWIRKTN